ncbi:hypothetical protein SNE40_004760 [Patella caerulea]|uniref:Uncharacterized protein n=1 Tax=Patella caerulea TaxID=87958 RepID=A0AAN8PXK2_PATCE
MLLLHLRAKIIAYASYKKKNRVKKEKEIEEKINLTKSLIEENPNSQKLFEEFEILNAKLVGIRNEKMTGVMIRSRAQWYEEGEKSSNYFANLEKRNFTNNSILELERNNGETIKDQAKILKCTKNGPENFSM